MDRQRLRGRVAPAPIQLWKAGGITHHTAKISGGGKIAACRNL